MRPVFVTKFIMVGRLGDVSKMSLDSLRQRWEAGLSHRGSCRTCESPRVWHLGIRRRKASFLHDAQVDYAAGIPIRRLKCRDCGARWFHPAAGISSRAHYQPCVVAHALESMGHQAEVSAADIAAAHGCHRRTLGRWIERVAEVAEPAVLGAAVVAEAGAPVLPVVPTEVLRPGGRHVHKLLLRALVVLALLEALASLRALEPPALAHAAVLAPRVPADAPGPRSRGDPRSVV